MIKYKNSLILNLILVYLTYLFFYGIVIKFTVANDLLFLLKTYVPELILFVIVILSVLKYNVRITYKALILAMYLAIVVILNYIVNGATIQSFYWWRDLIIPFLSAIFISNIKFTTQEKGEFLRKLVFLAKCFLFLGFTLAVMQQVMGDQWTSKFYTGYSFYGQDPYSKVKIAHNMGLLRAPSLTGNFSSFAYYSCFCIFIILNKCRDKFENGLWLLIAFVNCLISTNKSAVIVLFVVLLIKYTEGLRKKHKKVSMLVGISILVILSISIVSNVNSMTSLNSEYTGGFFQRFGVWTNILEMVNPWEFILPYRMFLYGSGGVAEFSFFDNIYLYGLLSQGIFGILLWISYIKELCIYRSKRIKKLCKDVLYFLLIIGLTSNVIQGHAYFNIFLIFLSIFFNDDGYKDNAIVINNLGWLEKIKKKIKTN